MRAMMLSMCISVTFRGRPRFGRFRRMVWNFNHLDAVDCGTFTSAAAFRWLNPEATRGRSALVLVSSIHQNLRCVATRVAPWLEYVVLSEKVSRQVRTELRTIHVLLCPGQSGHYLLS